MDFVAKGGTWRWRPLYARVRGESPIAPILLVVLVGQALALIGASQSSYAGFIILLSCLLLFWFLWKRSVLWSALCVGLLSGGLHGWGGSEINNLSPEHSYLMQVTSQPRFRRVGEVEFGGEVLARAFAVESHAEGEENEQARYSFFNRSVHSNCRAIYLPWKGIHLVQAGDVLVVKAKFRSLQASPNPFAYQSAQRRKGSRADCKIKYAWRFIGASPGLAWSWRQTLSKSVTKVLGEGEAAGLLLSLGLGYRDQLSDDTENRFKMSGLSHLLVFSGYQVSLVFTALLGLMKAILLKINSYWPILHIRPLVGLFALLGLAPLICITGLEPSSLRSITAIVILAIIWVFDWRCTKFNSLCLSLLVLSLVWPGCIMDPGVQLTYSALLGIWLGTSSTLRSALLRYLIVFWYTGLCTAVVALIWFNQLSLIGLLVNPFMVPLFSFLACNLSYIALLIFLISGWGQPLYYSSILLLQLRDWVYWFADLHWSAVQIPFPYTLWIGLGMAAYLSAVGFQRIKRYCMCQNLR